MGANLGGHLPATYSDEQRCLANEDAGKSRVKRFRGLARKPSDAHGKKKVYGSNP
jgi:hypothetical protein